MRLQFGKIRLRQLSLPNVYMLSLVITFIYLLTRKSELLMQTNLFDEASLKLLKEQTTGSNTLFFYALKERLIVVLSLFLMSTTNLSNLYVQMNVILAGAGCGFLMSVALLRYGLKGLLLLVGGMFPHYLIYGPAFCLVLQLTRNKRYMNGKFFAQLGAVILVVITGCLLECYVNPGVVAKLLKNF